MARCIHGHEHLREEAGGDRRKDRRTDTKYTSKVKAPSLSTSPTMTTGEMDRSTNHSETQMRNYHLQLAPAMPSDMSVFPSSPPVLPQASVLLHPISKASGIPPETLPYPAIHSCPNFFPRTLSSTGNVFLAGVSVSVRDRAWQGNADVSL